MNTVLNYCILAGLISSCAGYLDYATLHAFCQERNGVTCRDGNCIPKYKRCDGRADCYDSSDEEDCDLYFCNKPKYFKCKNERCTFSTFVCDGDNDCGDNSDETNCHSFKGSANFTHPKHPRECNGFTCKNGRCISNDRRCNGNNDCRDNSDEIDCSSHKCFHLPNSRKCLCRKGYQTLDDKFCRDVNECEIYGICDQKCKNTPGSYQCYCNSKYKLQKDKKTCKAIGAPAQMIYSSKTDIRGYNLGSEFNTTFSIVRNLKQVIGVSFHRHHVYWTDVFFERESISRSLEDGSKRESLVTSGLGTPEDLALDWITGNIYFTDSKMEFIAVCLNDGTKCAILVNQDINKPRGIVLNPLEGDMYWSDWGKKPEIAKSKMDGSERETLIANEIWWPNGLAIDYPNERLYWTDAKLSTIESVRLDGTDRRIILENIVKQHPYAIAIFENRLFWSDWSSHSVKSCNKFTGKDNKTLIVEENEVIYGLDIFHPALKPKIRNPCISSLCSDICLNVGPKSYTCACPQHKELAPDNYTCIEIYKKQELFIGANNLLIRVGHKMLGKHVTNLPTRITNIGALAYNPINDTLYISDNSRHIIFGLNLKTNFITAVVAENLISVNSLEYDSYGNHLYWCDPTRKTLEILNLNTMTRKVLLHAGGETPQSIALVPEEGVIFIAFEEQNGTAVHLDKIRMDGAKRSRFMQIELQTPVTLHYDASSRRIFWVDGGTSKIESMNLEGDDRVAFRKLPTTPVSITTLEGYLFWINYNSSELYSAELDSTVVNNKIAFDIYEDTNSMHLVSMAPIASRPCLQINGICSDSCPANQSASCACPIGTILRTEDLSCVNRLECTSEQFNCEKSDVCVAEELRCNERKDCKFGEDEEGCVYSMTCPESHFRCENGDCLEMSLVCNTRFDCEDKSDEANCPTARKTCGSNQFKCTNDECISGSFVCDGIKDCSEGEDEMNCRAVNCSINEFRCQSGVCLPKAWECDHEYDCRDLSDEHENCTRTTCSLDQFNCANGLCIDLELKCDNVDDCGDSSDETSCTDQPACKPDEFECENSGVCLKRTAVCNGKSDCPDGEDEEDCSNCHANEFSCDNKRCVPNSWICDGLDDCGDGSDEASCSIKNKFNNNPCENGFRCKSGACIDFSFVCNGIENCADGSDENGSCYSSCKPLSNPCYHGCKPTPTGPICTCRDGYELADDKHSCRDVAECSKDPPVCSQKCTEKIGGFACDCFEGFLLRSDKSSCKSRGDPMSIIYAVNSEIRQLSELDNSLKIVHWEESSKISDLDVDVSNNQIYFSVEGSGTLFRLNLKNGMKESIDVVGKPQKLSVDWLRKNVYYGTQESISACNFEEKRCAKIVKLKWNDQVTAIAIDAVNKYMFYSLTSNTGYSILYKANLDGSGITQLTENMRGPITGITYDANRRVLYYINNYKINRINYNSANVTVIFTNITKADGMNLFEDHLYFLTGQGYMSKCKLFEQRTCETFKLNAYSVESFAIMQGTRQLNDHNLCEGHYCHHLCLPGGFGVHCVCEDGRLVDQGVDCRKSDEYGSCYSSWKPLSNPCYHGCKPTPTGPICTCRDGYELAYDKHSCRDVAECSKDPPVCRQKCTEKIGGFTCDCFEGFLLRSDKSSCKSRGDPMSIIYAVNSEIRQLSELDNSLKIVHWEESSKISDLDVDVSNNQIYFSVEGSGTLFRLNLKNGMKESIDVVGKPQKLSVDWLRKNVYYGTQESISACNFEEKRCAKIVKLKWNDQVTAIANDAVNKYMFYSLTSNTGYSILYKANLDGSGITQLTENMRGPITGITYDANRRVLYYINNNKINRINYNNANVTVIFTNITKADGMNLFEDHLYFLTGQGYMSKCKLFEQRTCETFKLNAYSVESFAIMQGTRQQNDHNLCEGHYCHHLCLPGGFGVHCVCEDGRLVDQGVDCRSMQIDRRTKYW